MILLFSACGFLAAEVSVHVSDVWGNPVPAEVTVAGLAKNTDASGVVNFLEEDLYSEEINNQIFEIQARGHMHQMVNHMYQIPERPWIAFSRPDPHIINVNLYPLLEAEGLYLIGEREYELIPPTTATEKPTDLDVYVGFEKSRMMTLKKDSALVLHDEKIQEFVLHQLVALETQSIKRGSTITDKKFELEVIGSAVPFQKKYLSQQNVYRISLAKDVPEGRYVLGRESELTFQESTTIQAYVFQKSEAQ